MKVGPSQKIDHGYGDLTNVVRELLSRRFVRSFVRPWLADFSEWPVDWIYPAGLPGGTPSPRFCCCSLALFSFLEALKVSLYARKRFFFSPRRQSFSIRFCATEAREKEGQLLLLIHNVNRRFGEKRVCTFLDRYLEVIEKEETIGVERKRHRRELAAVRAGIYEEKNA